MGRPKGEKNRYYSKQFKMEVINELLNGESTRSISRKYDINRSNVERWNRQYREHGEAALESKRKPGNPFGRAHFKKHISEVDGRKQRLK